MVSYRPVDGAMVQELEAATSQLGSSWAAAGQQLGSSGSSGQVLLHRYGLLHARCFFDHTAWRRCPGAQVPVAVTCRRVSKRFSTVCLSVVS